MTDEVLPDYPPLYVRIAIPLDEGGVPFIDDSGSAPDWLIQAALVHLLNRMHAEEEATILELTPGEDDDE